MSVVKMEGYEPNSFRYKEEKKAKERPKDLKIEKVVTGEVIRHKKKLLRRAAEALGLPEGRGTLDYLLKDIGIPMLKEMLYTFVVSGASMTLFNEVRDRTRFGSGYTPYSKGSRITVVGGSQNAPERPVRRAVASFDDVVLQTKAEAEDVLFRLSDLCENYGEATVSDLYACVGITAAYPLQNYGWKSLADARIVAVRDGWLLDLPKEQYLK